MHQADGAGLISTLEPAPRGVVFDYGNTLIPFGRREMDAINAGLVAFLVAEIPGADEAGAREALSGALARLHRQRLETDRESDPRDVIRLSFATLGAGASEDDHVDRGVALIRSEFVHVVRVAPYSEEVLRNLRDRGMKLGLLSNYSLAAAIRESLEKIGLARWFDAIVVSADLGLVKPHPEIFRETARRLGLAPEEVLFVGDNPRADLAGASAVGMRTAHVVEHLAGAYHFSHPEENEADVRPDLALLRLRDLTHGGS